MPTRRLRLSRSSIARLAIVVGGVWAGGGAVAHAAVQVPPLRSGPVLTAGGVAWAEPYAAPSGEPGYLVRSAPADGSVGARLPVPGTPGVAIFPELHASAELLAVGEDRLDRGDGGRYIAPASGPSTAQTWTTDGVPLARFGQCGLARGATGTMGAIGADGHEVATCDATGRTVLVVDGRTGQVEQQFPTAAQVAGVRLAGPFVAWLENLATDNGRYTLVVTDRASGREVLRTPTTALGGSLTSWDLGADGTVGYAVGAVAGSADRLQRIGWTSAGSPVPHPLAVRPSARYAVRAAPGALGFQRIGPAGTLQLGVAPLDGAPARLLADGVVAGFDLDATRVTFAHPGCADETIETRPLTAARYDAPPPTHCVLPLRTSPQQRGSTLAIAVACDHLPLACEGPATLALPRGHGHSLLLARGNLAAGTATLHLRATACRLLRARHTLTAGLSVAFGPVDPDHPVIYRRTVRLRASLRGARGC